MKRRILRRHYRNSSKLMEYTSPNDIMWYHGSDKKLTQLKASQQLKLNYITEDGAWLTSNMHQAGFYGKYIYKFDCSMLNILNKSNITKIEFVFDFWVNKLKKPKKLILNSLRLNDKFKDLYDYAFMIEVEDKGFDAVELRGEFNKGFDLWIGYSAIKKIRMIF